MHPHPSQPPSSQTPAAHQTAQRTTQSRISAAPAPDPDAMLDSVQRGSLASDPLSAALAPLRVRAMMAGVSEMRGSWGLRCPTGPGGFYAVLEGTMFLLSSDGATPVLLSAGDCAFITRGDEHVIRSDAHAKVRPVLESFSSEDARQRRGVRLGSGGQHARFICGATIIDHAGSLSLIGGLPELIVSRRAGRREPDALWTAVDLMTHLCADHSPGAQSVLDHLGAIVLIQTLRGHVASAVGTGAALLDRDIGPVLGLMHGEPGRAWTLETLANEAGLSRSAFAERFAALVGEPPMSHLRACRMRRAAELLRASDDDVRRVAKLVGYSSEGAFCAAFKKWAGSTPEEFRNQQGLTRPD